MGKHVDSVVNANTFAGRRRANLASGTDLRPAEEGWVNFDIVKRWPSNSRDVDVEWDARKNVIPFPDGWFDEIVAGYLFLHVPYPHHIPLAKEMFRVMRPGARLEIGEVDMPMAMRRWMEFPCDQSARDMIWGERGAIHGPELEQYDIHCAGHSEKTMRKLLTDAGFVDLRRYYQHAQPTVWYEMSIEGWRP